MERHEQAQIRSEHGTAMLSYMYYSAHSKTNNLELTDFMPTLAGKPKPKGIDSRSLIRHARQFSHG